jgi:PAS domain-containing protein
MIHHIGNPKPRRGQPSTTKPVDPPKLPDPNQSAQVQIEKVMAGISDSIVALDTNWIYTYVNEKAAQTFGRTPEQLIGKHIWTEFPEGIGQPFYQAYYKAAETQQPIFLEEYYPPYDRLFENRI